MKIRFKIKANDELIKLVDVPFDTSKFSEVAKALSTLASDKSEVEKIVKLKSRTDKQMLFDFQGSDSVLQPFFEQYYSVMNWEDIRKKFNGRSESVEEKTVADELQEYLRKRGSNKAVVTVENDALLIENLGSETREVLSRELFSEKSELFKLLRKHSYEPKQLLTNKNPVKLLLKRVVK